MDSGDGAERGGRNLAAGVLATAALAIPGFLVGTMAVQLRASLRFSSTGLGMAVGAFYLGAALSSVPSSRLAERIGGVRIMRVAAVAAAAVLVLLGTAVGSWMDLTVLLFVAGVFSGAMGPAVNLFLARRSPERRQGLAFGVKQAAIPLASLLGGLAVPAITLQVGWRWTFALSALVAVAAALMVPRARQSLAERRRQLRTTKTVRVRRGPLVVIGLGFGLGVMAASGTTAFLVSAAVATGFSKGGAGLLAGAAGACAVAGRVLTGVRADRRGQAHFPVVAGMLAAGAAGYALLAAGLAATSTVAVAAGAVLALGLGWGWNGLLVFAVVRSHPDSPAAATGITAVGGRLGGVIGPLLFGVVVAHASYADAWLVAVAAALGSAGAVLVGSRLLAGQPAMAGAAGVFPPGPAADGSVAAVDDLPADPAV